jgi:hypothetical protein
LVGVSLIGSSAITRRPVDDLGFSVTSEDGAKRPLIYSHENEYVARVVGRT